MSLLLLHPTLHHKLLVAPLLHQLPLVHHHDLHTAHHSAKPVRNNYCFSEATMTPCLDVPLLGAVQGVGHLIIEHVPRLLEQFPGDGQPQQS